MNVDLILLGSAGKGIRSIARHLDRTQDTRSAIDVHGQKCIHVEGDGMVCGKRVSVDAQQGWVCGFHDSQIRGSREEVLNHAV